MDPPSKVIDVLKNELVKPGIHQYQSYQGIPELREAIKSFYLRQYVVDLDVENEILPLIGSKEGITHVSLAYVNEGDEVLIPEIGYPTYTSVTEMVGGIPKCYALHENGEPDLTFFKRYDFSNTKLIWINFPHMPTGYKGSLEVMKFFVELAHDHGIILVHDNPYSFILNDDPKSIFNIEGAKDVALELNSLSKSFNMAGWRVGWACGNHELVKNVLRVKSNMDSGMFKPIQVAASEVLKTDKMWFPELNKRYNERRGIARRIFEKLRCKVDDSQVGMFLWGKSPQKDVDPLVDDLLYNKSIFITPGHIFGEKGRSFLRVSLCSSSEILEEAFSRLQ